MNYKYASGHDNQATAAAFPYQPKLERPITFQIAYSANGVGNNVGGGSGRLVWEFAEYDETETLLNFLGLNQSTPSAKATLIVSDLYRIPVAYNCVVTLVVPALNPAGWWQQLALEISSAEVV